MGCGACGTLLQKQDPSEIADKYNLSRERIRQIELKALKLLKKQDELKACLIPILIIKLALKYTGFKAWKENMESSVERAVQKKKVGKRIGKTD